MNATFTTLEGIFLREKKWSINDTGIVIEGKQIPFEDIISAGLLIDPITNQGNGTINIKTKTKAYIVCFSAEQREEAHAAIEVMLDYYRTEEEKVARAARREKEQKEIVYDLKGVRGRSMKVYEDRCVIRVQAGMGSFLTGNVSDGEKTIYYADCNGVQFKASGFQLGYIQLETSSSLMNRKPSNFFNENTFTFDLSVTTNEKMREVADYILDKVAAIKKVNGKDNETQISAADELMKFKALLDSGVITQEEFDAKKKQLLEL